jgi:hypothetical protein
MPIVATPEVGIPLPFDTSPEEIDDFRQKAHAMFLTIEELHKNGLPIEITEADKKEAHLAFAASKPLPKNATPGAIVHLEAMLSEWDHEVLDVGRRLRNYVTNKLLLETADPDSKVRLRALELLGKVSSVGLFSERIDVNVTHRTINDIENELKKTLELFGGDVVDVEELNALQEAPKAVAEIDLDAELGTETPADEPPTA